jgi:CIC family chloride channel protein
MAVPTEIIYPFTQTVMNKFERSKVFYRLKDDKYYGFISKSIALEAYRTKLKSMTIVVNIATFNIIFYTVVSKE